MHGCMAEDTFCAERVAYYRHRVISYIYTEDETTHHSSLLSHEVIPV